MEQFTNIVARKKINVDIRNILASKPLQMNRWTVLIALASHTHARARASNLNFITIGTEGRHDPERRKSTINKKQKCRCKLTIPLLVLGYVILTILCIFQPRNIGLYGKDLSIHCIGTNPQWLE